MRTAVVKTCLAGVESSESPTLLFKKSSQLECFQYQGWMFSWYQQSEWGNSCKKWLLGSLKVKHHPKLFLTAHIFCFCLLPKCLLQSLQGRYAAFHHCQFQGNTKLVCEAVVELLHLLSSGDKNLPIASWFGHQYYLIRFAAFMPTQEHCTVLQKLITTDSVGMS